MEKVVLDALSSDSVSIKKQLYIEHDGVAYAAGPPHRCAYVNTDRGRGELAAVLPEPYLSAVMAVWGASASMAEAGEEET